MSYGIAISHFRCTIFFIHHCYFMGNRIMKMMNYMAKVQKNIQPNQEMSFFVFLGRLLALLN